MPNIRKKTDQPKLNLKQNLQNKYVAFLDVMGFSNLVYSSRVDILESYFDRIIEVLEELKIEKANIQSFQISDSIILICPDSPKDFKNLILAIRRIQNSLLYKKILLRGAISYGKVYYNSIKNIIVGVGYIRAYKLEQEAKFPRVIIDPIIVKHIANDRQSFIDTINAKDDINIDSRYIYERGKYSTILDDAIFIDYATRVLKSNKIYANFHKLYDTIVENFYGDQSLYIKYVWLKDYFLEHLQIRLDSIPLNKHDTNYANDIQNWIDKFKRL